MTPLLPRRVIGKTQKVVLKARTGGGAASDENRSCSSLPRRKPPGEESGIDLGQPDE